jgi:hypothetical protein
MTSLTYTVRLPDAVQKEIPRGAGAKNQAIFYSTTFVTHLRRAGNELISDVRTWSEDREAEGWLANPENQPQGDTEGGGPMKRDAQGRYTLIPKTTDFAPEVPVPTFPAGPVRPGSAWTANVIFEGRLQTVVQRMESYEERSGINCMRIEVTGLTFSGLPLSAPMVVWVDPTNGRTIRMEGIFRRTDRETTANIFFVRSLAKVEGAPQPKPVTPPRPRRNPGEASLSGPILPRPGG